MDILPTQPYSDSNSACFGSDQGTLNLKMESNKGFLVKEEESN